LGTHVQRLATIAHGDGVCTTFIPNNTTFIPNNTIIPNKSSKPKEKVLK